MPFCVLQMIPAQRMFFFGDSNILFVEKDVENTVQDVNATKCNRMSNKRIRKLLDRRLKRFEVVPICFTAIQGQKLTLPDRKKRRRFRKLQSLQCQTATAERSMVGRTVSGRMSGPELLPLSGWEGEKGKRNIEMLSLPRKFRNISHKVFRLPWDPVSPSWQKWYNVRWTVKRWNTELRVVA